MLPQINNKTIRGRDALIPGLSEEIFLEILQYHPHRVKHWQKQLDKVKFHYKNYVQHK